MDSRRLKKLKTLKLLTGTYPKTIAKLDVNSQDISLNVLEISLEYLFTWTKGNLEDLMSFLESQSQTLISLRIPELFLVLNAYRGEEIKFPTFPNLRVLNIGCFVKEEFQESWCDPVNLLERFPSLEKLVLTGLGVSGVPFIDLDGDPHPLVTQLELPDRLCESNVEMIQKLGLLLPNVKDLKFSARRRYVCSQLFSQWPSLDSIIINIPYEHLGDDKISADSLLTGFNNGQLRRLKGANYWEAKEMVPSHPCVMNFKSLKYLNILFTTLSFGSYLTQIY